MGGQSTTTGSPTRARRGAERAPRWIRAAASAAVGVLGASLLVAVSVVAAPAAAAAPGDYGTAGASLVGFASPTPTATKPESKLWFAHGDWWASMASATTGGYSIFRLDRASSTWVDTGVALDPRGATQADTLWNGTHLLVASHPVAASSTTTSAVEPARLFRYSWSGSAWTPDAGFPVDITGTSSESLTIAQTDGGRLWATWTLNRRLYVAQTTGSADAETVAFGSSFIPAMDNLAEPDSAAATTLEADDISTVASADGVTTLLWSNQLTGTTWSARRTDADGGWTATPVLSGALMADDHLNLRAIPGDPARRVVAVLKTSRNDAVPPVATDPLLSAAVFTPAEGSLTTGTWTLATIATVGDSATRPMAVVEPATGELHVFYTAPSTAGLVVFQGTVYEKTASLSTLAFPDVGTPVLRDVANPTMNNATTTRQPATDESGVVVLAATTTTPQYWSVDSGPRLPPAPVASFAPSATSGTAPVEVSFGDTSTGSPTSWSWSFGDGGTSTEQSPTHTFEAEGTYDVTLTVGGPGGSTTSSATVQVLAPPPVASFTGTPLTGTTPLEVAFTDTSTGSPTSWAWDFGDGGTSAEQSPTHTFAADGTFTVTLTATTSGGSTSATTVVVSSPPAVASFTSTRSGDSLSVAFADTSTGSPTSWAWDFGDGATSTEQDPVHVYAHAGPRQVSLRVVNAQGSTSRSESTVMVGSAPAPALTAVQPAKDSFAVDLTDASTGDVVGVDWDFGDGTTLAGAAPGTTVRHVYAKAGTYTVTVTAANGAGSAAASLQLVLCATPLRITKPTDAVAAGRKVVVGWTVPDMRGARIDQYQVVCRATGSVHSLLVAANDSAASIGKVRSRTLTSLSLGRRYTCTVRAHNVQGWSIASLATNGFTARS